MGCDGRSAKAPPHRTRFLSKYLLSVFARGSVLSRGFQRMRILGLGIGSTDCCGFAVGPIWGVFYASKWGIYKDGHPEETAT